MIKKLILALLACAVLRAQNVAQVNYTAGLTNANIAETTLTQANVSGGGFHKLGKWNVDGVLFAQPLVVNGGCATHSLITATMNNTLACFDADRPNTIVGTYPIWSDNFGTPYSGYPSAQQPSMYSSIGVLSTPVIDTVNGIVYVVSCDSSGNFTIRSINLTDGSVHHAGTLISGSDAGITFNASVQMQRPGLLLSSGKVYVAFGSYGDNQPTWQGWVFAYDATTLAKTAVWCSEVTGNAGSVWQAGGGIAADGSGNLYVQTGNGDWDGINNFGDSIVKLSPALTVLDYFTPANQATLSASDEDLGSSHPIFLGTGEVGGVGKDGNFYLLSQTTGSMGRLQGGGGNPAIIQTWQTGNANFGGLAFANNNLFVGSVAQIYRFTWNGTSFTTTPAATSPGSYQQPGAVIAYSSNGSAAGTDVLWALTVSSNAEAAQSPVTFRAMKPSDFSDLYNTFTSGDNLGYMAKFVVPVVANGTVYIATSSNAVYGYGIGTRTPAYNGVLFGMDSRANSPFGFSNASRFGEQ